MEKETRGRRAFLSQAGGLGALTLAGASVPPVLGDERAASLAVVGPLSPQQRRLAAFHVRQRAALAQFVRPLPPHVDNGDDGRYPSRIASFTKALPHDELGQGSPSAYGALLRALRTGRGADWEAIPMGGAVKLANPQAAFCFDLEGADSHALTIPPAPAFASAWEASEMAELYWQALTRDVPFFEYDTSPLVAQAAADLSAFSDFRGPKDGGVVTPGTLFRGDTAGDRIGPYISQFLWRNVPYGATTIVQRYRTGVPGDDHLTAYAQWLAVQRGAPPVIGNSIDPTPRYIRDGRGLCEWDHRDFTYQGFLNAALILLGFGPGAVDAGNPYITSATQSGFSTFGGPHVLDLVARVGNAALRAAWCQKWAVHRRLRPEEFGGRVHNHRAGAASYPIHAELLHSPVLDAVFSAHGSTLLPLAYPEGCPIHPAYPAGHAAIAGAGVTVLKAFFRESFVVPQPVVADAEGLQLLPYEGPDLTVGNELNKLAANVALGRDTAGVHWRTDGIQGLLLGEQVAIGVLGDLRATMVEGFGGFSLTRFDGTTISV